MNQPTQWEEAGFVTVTVQCDDCKDERSMHFKNMSEEDAFKYLIRFPCAVCGAHSYVRKLNS